MKLLAFERLEGDLDAACAQQRLPLLDAEALTGQEVYRRRNEGKDAHRLGLDRKRLSRRWRRTVRRRGRLKSARAGAPLGEEPSRREARPTTWAPAPRLRAARPPSAEGPAKRRRRR